MVFAVELVGFKKKKFVWTLRNIKTKYTYIEYRFRVNVTFSRTDNTTTVLIIFEYIRVHILLLWHGTASQLV